MKAHPHLRSLTVGFLSGGGVLQLLNNYSTNIQQLFNNYSTIIQQPSPRPGDYSKNIQQLFNNDSTIINSCPKSVIDSD